MRYQAPAKILIEAAGSNVSEERFENESAAAYESGVHLEDPIEVSVRWEQGREKVTHIQSMFLPSYHAVSVAKCLRSRKT